MMTGRNNRRRGPFSSVLVNCFSIFLLSAIAFNIYIFYSFYVKYQMQPEYSNISEYANSPKDVDKPKDKVETPRSGSISMEILMRQLKGKNKTFDRSRPIFVDVGLNNGHDSDTHLNLNYSVIGVDAFRHFVEGMRVKYAPWHKFHDRTMFFNVGLSTAANEGKNLTIYTRRHGHPMASFIKSKACEKGWPCHEYPITVVQCRSILEIAGKQVEYLKIDIEMMHYVCLQALQHLPTSLLPRYVCWEDHDQPVFGKTVPYPVTDTKLLLYMWQMGYDGIKIVAQGIKSLYPEGYDMGDGRWSSALHPNDMIHLETRSENLDTEWKSIRYILQQGVMSKPYLPEEAQGGVYFDICMKLSDDASNLREMRHDPDELPISL